MCRQPQSLRLGPSCFCFTVTDCKMIDLSDGRLKVREHGRRVAVLLDVTALYVRALIAQVKVRRPQRRRQRLF